MINKISLKVLTFLLLAITVIAGLAGTILNNNFSTASASTYYNAGIHKDVWLNQNNSSDFYIHITNCIAVGLEIVPFFVVNKTVNFNFGCNNPIESSSIKLNPNLRYYHLASCVSEVGKNTIFRGYQDNNPTSTVNKTCIEPARSGAKSAVFSTDLQSTDSDMFRLSYCVNKAENKSAWFRYSSSMQLAVDIQVVKLNSGASAGYKGLEINEGFECKTPGFERVSYVTPYSISRINRSYEDANKPSLLYANCPVAYKKSFVTRFVSLPNNPWFRLNSLNQKYDNYNTYWLCGVPNIQQHFNSEGAAGSFLLTEKFSLNGERFAVRTCRFVNGTTLTVVNTFWQSYCNPTYTAINQSSTYIKQNSFLHVSYCVLKSDPKDIITEMAVNEINFETNLCTKHADRINSEANQRFLLNAKPETYSSKIPSDGQYPSYPYQPPAEWKLVGKGDFNADKNVDIVWRHNNGSIVTWLLDGKGNQIGGAQVASMPDTKWKLAITADLNGDGSDDLIWRHADGYNAVYYMDKSGLSVASTASLITVGSNWKMVSKVYANTDTFADIVWQEQTTGTVVVWNMQNEKILSGAAIGGANIGWQIVEVNQTSAQQKTGNYVINFFNQAYYTHASWSMLGLTRVYEVENNYKLNPLIRTSSPIL